MRAAWGGAATDVGISNGSPPTGGLEKRLSKGGRPVGAGPQAAPHNPPAQYIQRQMQDLGSLTLMRPVLTLKGEEPSKFHLYTVIRKKKGLGCGYSKEIRLRVSIGREIGFGVSITGAGRCAARPYYEAPKPYSPSYSHTLNLIPLATTTS